MITEAKYASGLKEERKFSAYFRVLPDFPLISAKQDLFFSARDAIRKSGNPPQSMGVFGCRSSVLYHDHQIIF
jgi:hypothetical protein